MKKFRILMGALALAVVAATVIACNKEKESNDVQQTAGTDEVVRKPIATYDNATGRMTYHLTAEMMQESYERLSFSKEDDRFLIESFEIMEMQSNDNDEKGIKFSVIDTESEESYTAFLNPAFLEKETFSDSIVYYIAEDVESGNFTFTNFLKDGVYSLTLSNFEVVGVEAIPDSLIYTAPRPKKTVTCKSRGCVTGGCQVIYDMYGNPNDCSECGRPTTAYVYCEKTITSVNGGSGIDWIGVVGIAVTIFLWGISHCL